MHNRTLYIHIGCHKTGTTSIQRTLQNNKHTLTHRGIQFFFRNFDNGKNELPDLHSWLTYDEERIPGEMRLRDVERLAQELSQLESDVIISSENFSFVYDLGEIQIPIYIFKEYRTSVRYSITKKGLNIRIPKRVFGMSESQEIGKAVIWLENVLTKKPSVAEHFKKIV